MENQSDLSDRIVIVVGATNAVAHSSAVCLARFGAQLILVDQRSKLNLLNDLAKSCDQVALHGNRWHHRNNKWQRVQKSLVLPLDFNDDPHVMVRTVIDTYGKIDGLVFASNSQTTNVVVNHNDSILQTNLLPTLDQVFTSELLFFTKLMQLMVPELEKTNGSVVNISTTDALKPDSNQLCTGMVRSAIDMMVKCLSLELGPKKVRVNSINHTRIASQVPQNLANGLEVNQRMMDQYLEQIDKHQTLGKEGSLRANQVSTAVLYLLTARASFLNGINLVIDGGCTL